MYVVRKMILSLKLEDKNQRHKYFPTRCTGSEKHFFLIIDYDSGENLVNKKIVDLLNFLVEPHLKP